MYHQISTTKFTVWSLLIAVFACQLPAQDGADLPIEEFEGKIEYVIRSDGFEWHLDFWKSGDLWRSELRSGKQLIDLRIGDLNTGEAYVVNETGKTYRPLGGGPRRGGGGGKKPESGNKKREPVDLEKTVQIKDDAKSVLGVESNLYEIKGKKPRFNLWASEALGRFPGHAIPVFEKTREKVPVFLGYFREYWVVPLELRESGKSEEKGFSMVALSIEPQVVDENFLTVPSDYQGMMTGPGGGNGGGGSGRSGGGQGKRGQGPPPGGGRR